MRYFGRALLSLIALSPGPRLRPACHQQVSGRSIPPPALAAAQRLAPGGKAQPALELVGYDAELSAAMKYVFGGAFICKVGGARTDWVGWLMDPCTGASCVLAAAVPVATRPLQETAPVIPLPHHKAPPLDSAAAEKLPLAQRAQRARLQSNDPPTLPAGLSVRQEAGVRAGGQHPLHHPGGRRLQPR